MCHRDFFYVSFYATSLHLPSDQPTLRRCDAQSTTTVHFNLGNLYLVCCLEKKILNKHLTCLLCESDLIVLQAIHRSNHVLYVYLLIYLSIFIIRRFTLDFVRYHPTEWQRGNDAPLPPLRPLPHQSTPPLPPGELAAAAAECAAAAAASHHGLALLTVGRGFLLSFRSCKPITSAETPENTQRSAEKHDCGASSSIFSFFIT